MQCVYKWCCFVKCCKLDISFEMLHLVFIIILLKASLSAIQGEDLGELLTFFDFLNLFLVCS